MDLVWLTLPQVIANGLLQGSAIALGAIGLTLTYSILRFANFTHGETISWGGYFTLTALAALTPWIGGIGKWGGLTFGWGLVVALGVGVVGASLLALALDRLLFATLRRHGSAITLVIASFGASLALRNLIVFVYGPESVQFTRELVIADRWLGGLVRVTPDQLAVLGLSAALAVGLTVFLRFTTTGRAMRATAENPALAQITGIDTAHVVRTVWVLGAVLATLAGVFIGITAQLRPELGFDLLLPLFAAAILGGIGSVPGAMLGGLIVGLAESAAVEYLHAGYRNAVGFLVLIAILVIRPTGLFAARG
ncbi:MAG: branched-chain amino acid ABC transporter permease [Alphaproteobacteria bacterium]|nr:MAG: branched-chain amino acid ABC transporter permease [Alphaproteobacteria bacterium]